MKDLARFSGARSEGRRDGRTQGQAQARNPAATKYKTAPQGKVVEVANLAKVTAPPPQVQLITISDEDAGQRIDNFLLRICKGVPKSHIYRVLRSGEVRAMKG